MAILIVFGLFVLLAGAPLTLYFRTRRQNAASAKYEDHTTRIATVSAFTGEVIAKGTDVLSDDPDGRSSAAGIESGRPGEVPMG